MRRTGSRADPRIHLLRKNGQATISVDAIKGLAIALVSVVVLVPVIVVLVFGVVFVGGDVEVYCTVAAELIHWGTCGITGAGNSGFS